MTIAVLAEKPSVAREIAAVLGAQNRRDGALEGNGYVVTWAIGHLASLAQPHEIEPNWKRWNLGTLPMIPPKWPLRVYDKTQHQFDIVKKILCAPDTERIVCATDAGREGELIFRFIYEAAGATKPVQRLWISSLTNSAIRDGFSRLRPGAEFDGLADAARGRSCADWLVGMNLTRAYTLRQPGKSEVLSVGRVQTPTLAMVVERELAIRDFVPDAYREVRAVFRPHGADGAPDESAPSYEGTYFRVGEAPTATAKSQDKPPASLDSIRQAQRLPNDGALAGEIAERALTGAATVESVDGRQRKIPPPLLYDLTELQRHANRLYGYSAQKTLDFAQALYEKKVLSYPRTDSRVLTQDVAQTLGPIVAAISAPYAQHLAQGTGTAALGSRFINDAKVTDHHALIPTTTSSTHARLGRDEGQIYDMVCRRLLAAWHEDHLYSTTTVITTLVQPTDAGTIDRYRSTGTKVDRVGWRVLDPSPNAPPRKAAATNSKASTSRAGLEQELPPELHAGQSQQVLESHVDDKLTRPPRRFTEATLLTAMETAGKTLDDKDLSEAMRECGLGTPATRAGIMETLLSREYMLRDKKALLATDKGISLIEQVHPQAKSPAMTGQWEAQLRRIQDGEHTLAEFVVEIEEFVRGVVGRIKQDASTPLRGAPPHRPPPARPPGTHATASRASTTNSESRPAPASDGRAIPTKASKARTENGSTRNGPAAQPSNTASAAPLKRTPTAPDKLTGLLRKRFGFDKFRPHQEEVCRAITTGEDVLLVMPTGAGKSLCYQLPGIARGGTTLVISPLIALMEDQVIALQAGGFVAERIHSGRSRVESRQVCIDYLGDRLDFLFIAPERLSVPGFPEMLARRKPSLIAIDEAHCISQWGHDFRPDYRMLNERLQLLRPAPIVALTATATPRVQSDIVEQLSAPEAGRFIHGFRRDNIAIEVVEQNPSLRNDTTARLLAPQDRRPAIVYAPTRKKAEALAEELGEDFPSAAYHAGMDAARRDKVHAAFLAGNLDVVVATVAFGMGIDKPNVRSVVHLALPGSVEGYYQEIGRAGRDGLPSRAFLLHGYIDRRTHEWFLERDYPDPKLLKKLYDNLGTNPIDKAALRSSVRMNGESFERALEKLWIHGGARITPDESISRGHDKWRAPYNKQLEHRRAQVDEIAHYAEGKGCRMLRLVKHFGDQADDGTACGLCDICAPGECVAQESDEATPAQQAAMERILKTLATEGTPSSGRLHRDLFGDDFDRTHFEGLMGALHRAGFVHIEEQSFESEGRTIAFHRPVITTSGRRASAGEIAEVRIAAPGRVRKKTRSKAARTQTGTRKSGAKRKTSAKKKATRKPAARKTGTLEIADTPLHKQLRGLRLSEAERRGIPAFRIFTDSVLCAIADAKPRTETDLLAIKGAGPALVKKYGKKILNTLSKPTDQ